MFDCRLSDTPPPFNCHSPLVCVCVHEEGGEGGRGVEQDITMEKNSCILWGGLFLEYIRINKY